MQKSSLGTGCEIALRWIPQIFANEISTLAQVMAQCHHMTSLGYNELILNR